MHCGRIYPSLALTALSLLLASASCNRDDDRPTANPTIEFVTEPGFTYLSDTLPPGDTLLVGVRIRRGGDRLNTKPAQGLLKGTLRFLG
ncbi:MAG: hypothetical protein KF797_03910 [Flavobacteriales bacterium]|nr:hypothetical protein [Flavobacteriales bacterium]